MESGSGGMGNRGREETQGKPISERLSNKTIIWIIVRIDFKMTLWYTGAVNRGAGPHREPRGAMALGRGAEC